MEQIAHEDGPELVISFFWRTPSKSHGGLSDGPSSAPFSFQVEEPIASHLLSTLPVASINGFVKPSHG
jgi:hypothetical protein